MAALPTSPETPTVYVIAEQACGPDLRRVLESGIAALGAGPCDVADLPVGPAPGDADRARVLEFLLDSYNARGAFVDGPAEQFFDARLDAYDMMDEACTVLGEVGVIVRRPGSLRAAAPRLAAAARAAERVLRADTPEVLVFGSGPDARALAAALGTGACAVSPAKITLAGNNAAGLALARRNLAGILPDGRLEIRHIEGPAENDRLLALLPPGSGVVRAVDGKDSPAVGAASAALYPEGAVIWDMRAPATGSPFLASAVRQREIANLTLSDRSAYREERHVAVLDAIFGEEAGDAARQSLRDAIREVHAR
ncbi:MAG: hypothetical protein JJ899_01850 [Alphaproteobacteria bacterium]|nr:hypothetical protein [Alphaproteobacteria bacterium]